MKKNYLIALILVAGGAWFAPLNAAEPKPTRAPTLINSDTADFDLTARRATYLGNVRVDDPQMTLTCVRLTADLPQANGQMRHIVAETNVVIISVDEKGQTNHATSDRAIYDYEVKNGVTNETVTLSGNAKMENAQGTLTGEPIIWDRANNRLTATNQKMIFRQNAANPLTGTNATVLENNLVPARKVLPVNTTNLPPATIPAIDPIHQSQTP